MVKRVDPHGGAGVLQDVFGLCAVSARTEAVGCCRLDKKDTKGYWKMANMIFKVQEGEVPDRDAKGWKVDGEKRRVTRNEGTKPREEFEVGGFMAQKGLCKPKRECYPKRRETQSENTRPCTRTVFSTCCGMTQKVNPKKWRKRTRKLNKRREKVGRGSLREKRKGWLWFVHVVAALFLASLSEGFLEKGLEEEVVDLSRDESEHWCEVCVCACFCSFCACSDFACEHSV